MLKVRTEQKSGHSWLVPAYWIGSVNSAHFWQNKRIVKVGIGYKLNKYEQKLESLSGLARGFFLKNLPTVGTGTFIT
jgi:hypothetical protein